MLRFRRNNNNNHKSRPYWVILPKALLIHGHRNSHVCMQVAHKSQLIDLPMKIHWTATECSMYTVIWLLDRIRISNVYLAHNKWRQTNSFAARQKNGKAFWFGSRNRFYGFSMHFENIVWIQVGHAKSITWLITIITNQWLWL